MFHNSRAPSTFTCINSVYESQSQFKIQLKVYFLFSLDSNSLENYSSMCEKSLRCDIHNSTVYIFSIKIIWCELTELHFQAKDGYFGFSTKQFLDDNLWEIEWHASEWYRRTRDNFRKRDGTSESARTIYVCSVQCFSHFWRPKNLFLTTIRLDSVGSTVVASARLTICAFVRLSCSLPTMSSGCGYMLSPANTQHSSRWAV